MTTNWDDSNWREESLPYYTGKQEKLLREGPHSLSQAWIMQTMYNEWNNELLPFGNKYPTRMDWPFSRSKLTNVELELDNIPDGLAKFAWGYELYHESLEGKGVIEGFAGNTFNPNILQYRLTRESVLSTYSAPISAYKLSAKGSR